MTNKKALSLVERMMTKVSQEVIEPNDHWEPTAGLVASFGELLSYRADLLDAITLEEIQKACRDEAAMTISQQSMAAGKECICQHNLLDLEA